MVKTNYNLEKDTIVTFTYRQSERRGRVVEDYKGVHGQYVYLKQVYPIVSNTRTIAVHFSKIKREAYTDYIKRVGNNLNKRDLRVVLSNVWRQKLAEGSFSNYLFSKYIKWHVEKLKNLNSMDNLLGFHEWYQLTLKESRDIIKYEREKT